MVDMGLIDYYCGPWSAGVHPGLDRCDVTLVLLVMLSKHEAVLLLRLQVQIFKHSILVMFRGFPTNWATMTIIFLHARSHLESQFGSRPFATLS